MSEAFWAFSLEFYQRPGVAESCLELQDRHGADVNMVLFVLWAASRGHRTDVAAIAEAERVTRDWRETVTRPLRAARRAMRTTPNGFNYAAVEALRQKVFTVELEAERLQQGAMEPYVEDDAGPPSLVAARENLSRYMAVLGKPIGPEPIEKLLDAFARFG